MLEMNGGGEHSTDWRTAHAALSRLAQERAAADAEEGRWLLAAHRAAVHVHLAMGSFVEYIERLFGYRPRSTHEKLRVAEALESLPALTAVLESGALHWSAVRELTRVAVQETEQDWIAHAVGKTLRQVEELVAGKHPGDSPSAPADPAALRHVLRFDVSAETYAVMREALAELGRRSGAHLDDDAALLELARSALGGPRDEGRSSYQIAMHLCPECSSARQAAGGELVPVGDEIAEMAECDAQCFVLASPGDAHGGAAEPSVSGAPVGTAPSHPAYSESTAARAAQSIPPATRRAVVYRDQHHCRVPGCRNAIYLDVHHIQLRSKGGAHRSGNLLTLCSTHHRAMHRGTLRIQGDADGQLRFSRSDGHDYGQLRGQPRPPVPAPGASELSTPAARALHAKVSSGLQGLGFRAADVQRVMRELQARDDLRAAPAVEWIRAALLRLHRPAAVAH